MSKVPLTLDNDLYFAVYTATTAFNRSFKTLLDPLRLTHAQYLTMVALGEHDNVTIKDLGERLAIEPSTITSIAKRLEAAARVVRTRNPEDEREVRITLTARGRALLTEVASVEPAFRYRVGLTPTDDAQVRRGLSILRETSRC